MSASSPMHSRSADIFVPEERALGMIESCAAQLANVLTIPDVQRVMSQADAITAVLRKIKASEQAKRAALRLQLEAEIALGLLTRELPQGRTGRSAAARPDQPTKTKALKEHGLHSNRVHIAEKLAEVPRAAIEDAMTQAKSKTVTGVASFLGIRQKAPYISASSMKKVAHDAIGLLVQCQTSSRAPKAEEVDPLREAFMAADTAGERQ